MSKNERVVVLLLLFLLLGALILFPPTAPNLELEPGAVLFAGLFLLAFTVLLLEHFFVRPTDVIAAGVSILLLMIPSRSLLEPWGSWYWAFLSYELLAVLLATSALLLLTDAEGEGSKRNHASRLLKEVATRGFSGRIQYFVFSGLSILFFVEPRSIPFVAFLLYAVGVLLFQPQRMVLSIPKLVRHRLPEVGQIFGVQGRNTFLVKLHKSHTRPVLRAGDVVEFKYGMEDPPRVRRGLVLERFFLDQAQWMSVLRHDEIDEQTKGTDSLTDHRLDAVYKLGRYSKDGPLGNLVGVVQDGTDIQTLRFLNAGRAGVREGDLVAVGVTEGRVLYQVVNATVDTEALERKNEADFVVGEGTQLGIWDSEAGSFDRYGWVPPPRTPVTRSTDLELPEARPGEVVLGTIPGTEFPVLLNSMEAISHHTAILGVTGVGKSVFARNLIRQFNAEDLRVIVVDFTREWTTQMAGLGAAPMLAPDLVGELRTAINQIALEESKFRNQQDADYIHERKRRLFEGFQGALSDFLNGDQAVRVFELPDVSNTQGVLDYTQWFFQTLFQVARESNLFGKRVCVVLEEAHTVVPEWNFIGLADKASQSLVNNISQIALQGRKHGIGFLVIAQRTANVSKTVLTQCNTIIAFQCFDGTSIDFLSNYVPRSVAQALPNLRFRRAVAVGKAIRGSVPLIFDVPEIVEPDAEAT